MKFTKEHIKVVGERLREYEEVLESKILKGLGYCDVCSTVPVGSEEGPCYGCLFSTHDNKLGCRGPFGYGIDCEGKKEIRAQYKHLLNRMDRHGYEFK
jgi:hypothetical protein